MTYCWWKNSQTTTWNVSNPVNDTGRDKLPTSTGFLAGFLKHQQWAFRHDELDPNSSRRCRGNEFLRRSGWWTHLSAQLRLHVGVFLFVAWQALGMETSQQLSLGKIENAEKQRHISFAKYMQWLMIRLIFYLTFNIVFFVFSEAVLHHCFPHGVWPQGATFLASSFVLALSPSAGESVEMTTSLICHGMHLREDIWKCM